LWKRPSLFQRNVKSILSVQVMRLDRDLVCIEDGGQGLDCMENGKALFKSRRSKE
jgi:hypothetical protein